MSCLILVSFIVFQWLLVEVIEACHATIATLAGTTAVAVAQQPPAALQRLNNALQMMP